MILEEDEYLAHYGILRRSGRYPYGSGGNNPAQRSKTFLDFIEDLKRRLGWGDTEIAKHLEISTTELRAIKTIAKNEQRAARISEAQRLKERGYSNTAAAQKMGIPESSFRALLDPATKDKNDVLTTTANTLRAEVDAKKFLDVGSGVENYLGVSEVRKNTAIAMLEEEGYRVHYVKVPQIGTGKETTIKVLAPPGTTYSEVFKARDEIKSLQQYSEDGGRNFFGIAEPKSINPDRLGIRYAEDGGDQADGVIYVRPGVDDLSMGGSRYAQVRIKVGEDHYIKGMAVYKDDLPDGIDLLFNTNKSDTGNKLDALKPLKEDPDNPFGSYIRRQITEKLPDGTIRATSAMNLVNEEGKWDDWSKTLSSQVLSKQKPELAKAQLGITYDRRQQEFDEIMALTNPTVRKKLLQEFADSTDSAAVFMKAAALPRQKTQVILPVESLPDGQIYAPNFRNGERVVLIRYPHGGTFEIPELTVNNRHPVAKRTLGDARDAVGINAKVAERLSGADFDGDTVLVIPNNNQRITHTPALQQLRGFDPRASYPAYEGMKPLSETRKQKLMGDVSNLITDMTIKGASHAEIARAVRHSMVVIDASKHNLNYRQSAIDNGIAQLKEKYQGSSRAGAATLISRAKSPERVPERIARRASEGGPIDPDTGRRMYTETGATYRNSKGELVKKTTAVRRLDNTEDAHTLSSGTPMERLYADHSNKLKALANQARRESLNVPRAEYSPSAARAYSKQVESLQAKLDLAVRNRPLERQAQVLANAVFRQKKDANPDMDAETIKKVKFQALEEARRRTGAGKTRIEITQDEWNAIQAGAISDSRLSSILANANMDIVRSLATPRARTSVSTADLQRARNLADLGYTRAEIADDLGISVSTLGAALTEDENG